MITVFSLVLRDLSVTAGELMATDDAWFWLNKCKFLAVILQVSTAKGNLLGGSAPCVARVSSGSHGVHACKTFSPAEGDKYKPQRAQQT